MTHDDEDPIVEEPKMESETTEPEPEMESEATQPNDTAEPSEARPEEPPATPEQVLETAQEFIGGVLEAMGLEGEVTGELDEGRAVINVAGPDMGGLIGRRGQTLDALQEIARSAVQRRLQSRIRLLVDVEGYRARRRSSLAEYAQEMAERAKERGTEIELEAMNSYDRKIVHDAVGEIEGASSYSEGEEPERKVIIRGE